MSFLSFFSQKENKELIKKLNQKKELILSGIGNLTAKSFLLSSFFELGQKSIVFVVNDDEKIREIIQDLHFWLDDYEDFLEIVDFSDNEEENQAHKIDLVFKLNNKIKIFIIRKQDIFNNFPQEKYLQENSIKAAIGDEFLNVEIFNSLIQAGYEVCHDVILQKGQYRRSGGVLDIFPVNGDRPYKIEIEFDKIVNIWEYDQENKQVGQTVPEIMIYPLVFDKQSSSFIQTIPENTFLFFDELDNDEEFLIKMKEFDLKKVFFTSFPQTESNYQHLRYLSVLKFYNLTDFLNDLREKIDRKWKVVIFSKRYDEIKNVFNEEHIPFSEDLKDQIGVVHLVNAENFKTMPTSFQNPVLDFELITDKEIFSLRKTYKNKTLKKMSLEFLSSLKEGDFVVHFDHGIGRFLGIVQREIDGISREYLEISYAENDKLFVPIDQADKVSKYISGEECEENEPRLSRLGSQEWKNITKKVKKETEKIAKELLQLYASRAQAKGHIYQEDNPEQRKFEEAFPYEETPGQIKAIQDIKGDMEGEQPMDRLVCGDVGFGKTEVAMRAAFKAVQNKKQVAFISPITILADQHYRTFKKRLSQFPDIKIEMLSRFRSPKEQRQILHDLKLGKIDIVVGTHRLLQDDIAFFNLGMVIIDEEQRFGVKQKEKLKSMRSAVDILTLTATPIPRTLNLSLNKLRDITIITTPPPGRLPIITEVRKYSETLIRESIMQEIDRNGQVYFLHNRVETIEGIAQKLRLLVPEARFIVAHGQLNSGDLEERIIEFKEHKYDVLISSTIIENGIDLANANTLIVNNAEAFGLSQLYQLRGRIGRGKVQAYAYLLYHSQKLKDDAKKRLKAIVEASELGSGFQIAMRDLEIRGAGEILGANQHGMMNIVGVGHFIRLLNQTIAEMKSGQKKNRLEANEDVIIELPIEAYIPEQYISDKKEKISVYQRLSAVDNKELLQELFEDIEEEFGAMPKQVRALFKILDIKLLARKAGLTHIKAELADNRQNKELALYLSDKIGAEDVVNLLKFNDKWKITGNKMKINLKELGFNWLDVLRENIECLV